jgi:hypothetical protein
MRKLALKIEELHVESFATEQHESAKSGTVRAHAAGWDTWWSCSDRTQGTCIGPTYCCPETWHTCDGNSCVWYYCDPEY